MNERDFVYWLKGYFELSGQDGELKRWQIDEIKKHLDLVLTKVTPQSQQPLIDMLSTQSTAKLC